MDLFSTLNQPIEVLPNDGSALYYGSVLDPNSADRFYSQLIEDIAWEHDRATIYGKEITTSRKVAWYGDRPYSYTYSKHRKTALPWIAPLLELKQLVQEESEENYNSCLLNLYHSGSEGMSWHSDAEKDLLLHGAIASLSLGAERKFCFKHKLSKEIKSLHLQPGSLLVMRGTTQENWLHSLPTTTRVASPRINLTFRTIDYST